MDSVSFFNFAATVALLKNNLGISKDANDDEIKKAYRKRTLVHHPDRHSSASEEERKEHEKKFKEVGEAYGVLSDAKKRARYDNGHDIDDLEGHGHGQFANDIDPNQIFQAFFSQGGGGGGGGGFINCL
jgi:DnaJ family protein C protein 7